MAEFVRDLARTSIEERGMFVVAVSGGSLPATLAGLVKDERVEWSKWHVVFVDERYVPLDHADSNYAGTQAALLKHVGIPSSQVHGIQHTLELDECAAAYQEVISRVTGGSFVLDLILLGMGEDGHTASLFPGHALLQENHRWIASIRDSPKPPPERITFTLPLIAKARHVAFVAAGAGKADPLAWIFKENKEGIPSGLVRKLRPDTKWFVDKAATAKL